MIVFWSLYVLTLCSLLYDAIWLNGHILSSWKWSTECCPGMEQTNEGRFSLKTIPDLIMVLPVLREQQQLAQVLHTFKNLSYPGKKHILVVTTEREIAENYGEVRGTTIESIQQFLAVLPDEEASAYEHLHFPFHVGNKASQLNYALEKIARERADLSTTYLGVYDADSRPTPKTLLSFLQVIAEEEGHQRPWPVALQQPSLFLRNFQQVSWYLQLEALFQTRWVLGHEIRTLQASTRRSAQRIAPYAYCVGHGMFVRADFLLQTGGFPEPSEDMPLGYRLVFLGVPIHPLPAYDRSEVAPRVPTLIRQSGFWCWNALLIWKEYEHVKQLGRPLPALRTITLLLKGLRDVLTWLQYPLHLLALAVLLFNHISGYYALLSILVWYLDSGLGIGLILSQFSRLSLLACDEILPLSAKTTLSFLISAPLRPLVRGLAPVLAAWFFLQMVCFRRQNVFPKTER